MKVSRIPIYILVTINVAVVLGLWVVGLCSTLNPNTYGWLSISGYALPIFALINIAFLALWIFIKKRFILISFVGLLCAYQPLILYFPLNTAKADADLPDSLITVLTYNTSNWGDLLTSPDKVSTPEEKADMAFQLIKQVNADILVLQESSLNNIHDSISAMYQYADTVKNPNKNGVSVTLLSRYPILRKEKIDFESAANACGAFWLNIKGREVIVINTHLEVMHFSMDERQQFSTIVHGKQKDHDSIRSTSHTIIGKIYNSTKIRANQADIIASFIKQHANTPIIIAGDFNDIPNSYVHKTILNALEDSNHPLTDCYASTGFGPGYTFKHFGIRVRIDNIMCSHHFTPYNCHIIKDISISDHQPVVCKLKIED